MRHKGCHLYAFGLVFTVKISTGRVQKVSRPIWKRVGFWFSSVYYLSLHFLLGILSNSTLPFQWISALYKLTVFPSPDFQSLLSSAVNLFTVSSCSNIGRIEVNPSPRQTCRGGTCTDVYTSGSLLAFSWQLPQLYSQALGHRRRHYLIQ